MADNLGNFSVFDAFVDLFTKQDTSLQFSTIKFWILFVVFFAFFISLRNRKRTVMMAYVIVFSLFIAFKANGWYMLLLPATVLLSWNLTELMKKASGRRRRKWWLAAIIVIDLLPLIYFKYTNFFVSTLNSILHSNFALLDIVLPVGLSFYTFQAISYAVDVYRGRYKGRPTLLEYLFYLSFFPLLLAGPITRAETLLPQLRRNEMSTRRDVWGGLFLILCGLVKKGVIADYIAQYNNFVFDSPATYSGVECLLAVVGYTLQIYFDFSGYSDLSIGLASMMGFTLRENFRMPYRSLNLTDFWRRWHISLSSWFRDYLYIPLGGNRKGKFRMLLNNFITMVVAGLWHGASWMFVIWGALHGLGLVVHKLCRGWLRKIPDVLPVRALSWLLTIVFVMLSWVFFRAGSVADATLILSNIFTDFDPRVFVSFWDTRALLCVIMAVAVALECFSPRFWSRMKVRFIYSDWLVKLFAVLLVVQLVLQLRSGEVQPFIYFQF